MAPRTAKHWKQPETPPGQLRDVAIDTAFEPPHIIDHLDLDTESALPVLHNLQASPAALDDLSALGFDKAEINRLVVPMRTLARRYQQAEPLTVEETDKALRLQRVGSLALNVFGDRDKAGRWLRKPKASLNGATPLDFLASEAGGRHVEDMLIHIDSGTFG